MAFPRLGPVWWWAVRVAVGISLSTLVAAQDTVVLEASHGFAAGQGPDSYQQLQEALTDGGLQVTVSTDDLTGVNLDGVTVIFLSVDWLRNGAYSPAERDILTDFVGQGGNLLALAGPTPLNNAHLNPVTTAFDITCGAGDPIGTELLVTGHPVAAGLAGWDLGPAGVLDLGAAAGSVAHNAGAEILIAAADGGTPGHKVVVVGSPVLRDSAWDASARRLVQNSLQWFGLNIVREEPTTWGGVKALYR